MGCEGFLRIVMVVMNVLFLLFGGAILGVSIWLQNDSDSLMQLFDGMPKDSGAVKGYFRMLGGIGFAIGITCLSNSWMGFTGACARHKILLYVYAGLVSCVLIIEISGVALAAVFSGQIQTLLTTQTTSLFKEYNANFTATGVTNTYKYQSNDKTTRALDSLQVRFECCGINGYQDYYNNTAVFPVTCCPQSTDDRGNLANSVFKNVDGLKLTVTQSNCPDNSIGPVTKVSGCYDKLEVTIKENATIVLGVLIAAALFQLAMVLTAIYLGKKAPKRDGCCGPITMEKSNEMS